MIQAYATVADVFNSEQLSKEESLKLVEKYQEQLHLNSGMLKRFGGKRYLVLITLKDFTDAEHFKINRSAFGNMDDWLPVGNIESVRM